MAKCESYADNEIVVRSVSLVSLSDNQLFRYVRIRVVSAAESDRTVNRWHSGENRIAFNAPAAVFGQRIPALGRDSSH